jgi:hypothetical protein
MFRRLGSAREHLLPGTSRTFTLDPLRDGYFVAVGIWVVAIAVGAVPPGVDATHYYNGLFPPYGTTDYAAGDGFFYPPPAALVLLPLAWLGLPILSATLTGCGLLALSVLLGRWAWLGLFFPPVWWDVSAGNVNTIIGAAVVLGFLRPGWWAVPLLTKVTPGIGVIWFLLGREWRPLSFALATTAVACGISMIVAPELWRNWTEALLSTDPNYAGSGYFAIPIPLAPRLLIAVLVLGLAAAAGWRWMVPIAAWLAVPVLWWSTLAVLVAVVPLLRRRGAVDALTLLSREPEPSPM